MKLTNSSKRQPGRMSHVDCYERSEYLIFRNNEWNDAKKNYQM